jgi:hypothetical protein
MCAASHRLPPEAHSAGFMGTEIEALAWATVS